ncbi:MAG: PfkB family carbohydrate kinase [Bacillus sp. (in: firmicutes)]
MAQLISIGEVLIDFIPYEKGVALKDVESFKKAPGGAPANVAAAVSKYGQSSKIITKLGTDAFGDFLIETLQSVGVDTRFVLRTEQANTGLAFVSLKNNGEREFSFFRNPSADLLLEADEIKEDLISKGDILHFCSVDLVESPMKYAHQKLIKLTHEKNGIVCFDPNVRLPLWSSQEMCKKTILDFIPSAHIIKISDEELEFITGMKEESEALESLFVGNVKVVVYTKGSEGACLLTRNYSCCKEGFNVNATDTTGAGDAFIGGFLSCLLRDQVILKDLEAYVQANGEALLAFSNASGALTTTKKGGISALPTLEEIQKLL